VNDACWVYPDWPRLWRMLVIGLSALILCSCRGPLPQTCETAAVPTQDCQGYPALPESAFTGPQPGSQSMEPPIGPPGMEQGVPLPYQAHGPWVPPGMSGPWPRDEYLRDGGDRGLPAGVGKQWEVNGLELEDTVAHFDTLDGRTLVQPSNRIHIYSPRFGAVRQVVSLAANEHMHKAAGMHRPEILFGPTTTQLVDTNKQNVQANRQIGSKPPIVFRTRQGDGAMSRADVLRSYQQDFFLPYENLKVIREGVIDAAERAFLARGSTAAQTWSSEQAVQVILDHQAAMCDISDQSLQETFTYKAPPGDPKLRLVKVASTPFAQPGEEVAFTLRFDNTGNQAIGNVTIIDNLTTRLEYVADSAQCSLDAKFLTQPNDGDSLVIRCEIKDPLEPGKGGVIRFRCKVR